MNTIKKILISFALAAGVTTFASPLVQAIDLYPACSGNSGTAVCKASGTDDAQKITRNIVSILLWAIAAVAVISIVVGGIKYATSNGDSSKIQAAKNTILYSVVGLVIAMIAQGVVLFVINWFG